ncbi:unnamed protein product [Hymenolepis diminuta]|uniref:non-specific serine/threonine protein kinase n=1 Tax=Hymenolepis diminuta TaxID=6216 RepID=A0A0R3S949_HYMDI|nr:unnamed protein product [Hymenolepis diminuta]
MVIDAPSEPAPYSKSVSQPIESLRGSKMDQYRDLAFSNSSSTSSHQASGGHQRVGTYIIERTIGKGNFSFVKLARHTVTNVKVAIKIIDKTKLNEENLKKAQREADILKSLHHPNIIKLYQVMESEKLLCIVTEYLPNGELYEYIARNGYLSEQVARRKFMEILSAVEHCHLNNVVHRDLKAENMLLDHHMSIKLADFGFGTFQPNGPNSLLTTWCGSPPYAAPEIFKGEPYLGVSADIWSLGVILYVLVCGVLPFNAQEVSCLRRQVLEEHVRVPYWLSMSCEDLLKRMLAKSPGKRPSIAEIKASKWLSEINDLGPVPFPIAMDEPDSASVHRLSTSLDAGKTGPSIIPHRSRSSVQSVPSPTLAAEMKAGKLDETVIQIMENSGIDRGQLLESLKRCAYDHLTATYLLLGESLRKNRHSLSQTLAPRTEEIEVLCQARKRQSQQQQQVFQHHQYQQPYARSSCPSGGAAVELLFQQHLPNWHHHHQLHNQDRNGPSTYFDVKNEPSISLGAPSAAPFACGSVSPNPNAFVCPNSGGNGLTSRGDAPIYPSSHPRQGFLFGPTLPLVVEFSVPGTGVGLRRTDASPSPPGSPINLSSRCTAESSNAGGNCGGDCFEFDWLPYQSEGVASSPAPVFSFGGELTPKVSFELACSA